MTNIDYGKYSENSLHRLLKKASTIRSETKLWEQECLRIKDSCKEFNDSLMIDIAADERRINKRIYQDIDDIKNQIDSLSINLKQQFIEIAKLNDIIDNEKDVFMFFSTERKKQAQHSITTESMRIYSLVNDIKKLWVKLVDYTGGYKCFLEDKSENLYYLTSMLHYMLNQNEKVSDIITNVSCRTVSCKELLSFCTYSRHYKKLNIIPHSFCYLEPSVKYQSSPLRSKLKEVITSPERSSPLLDLKMNILSKEKEIVILPKCPDPIYKLKRGSHTEVINLLDDSLNIHAINKVLCKKEKESAKLDLIKAIATKHKTHVRAISEKNKTNLFQEQTDILDCCPYCEKSLDEGALHLDHIHPVSKGGLSIAENLVYVCAECNTKKSHKTLRMFINESDLDRNRIEMNLELLKKVF